MLRALARRAGALSAVVELTEGDVAAPGAGECLLALRASTINPSDAVTVSGAYPSRTTFPFVPGFESVAEVVDVGAGVGPDVVGRRVVPVGGAGAWQQRRAVRRDRCVVVPPDLPDALAAFAYVNPVTALLMVAEEVPDDVGLAVVTAASSAIGRQLARLLRARGVTVVGVSSGRPEQSPVPAGEFSVVVDRRRERWLDDVRAAAPDGWHDVVLDCVGGPDATALLSAVRPGGRLVHYGLMSGRPIPADVATRCPGRTVRLFRLRDRVRAAGPGDLAALFDRAFAGLRSGLLVTDVAAEFPLAALPAAVARFESAPGKVLLRSG